MSERETMRLILRELFRVFAGLEGIPAGYPKHIYDDLEEKLDHVCTTRTIYEYVKQVGNNETFDLHKSTIPVALCRKILREDGKGEGLPEKASPREVIRFFIATYQPQGSDFSPPQRVVNRPRSEVKTDTGTILLKNIYVVNRPRSEVKRTINFWKISTLLLFLLCLLLGGLLLRPVNLATCFKYYGSDQAALRQEPYIQNFELFLDSVAENNWLAASRYLSKNYLINMRDTNDLKYAYRMTEGHTYHYYMTREIGPDRAHFVVDLEFWDHLPKWPAKNDLADLKIEKTLNPAMIDSLVNGFVTELGNNYDYGTLSLDSIRTLARTFLSRHTAEEIINDNALMEIFGRNHQFRPIIPFNSKQGTQDEKLFPQKKKRRNCDVMMVREDGIWKLKSYSSSMFMNGSAYY